MKYKHVFFDLDHTLWDFDTNARETLLELYDSYRLSELGVASADSFISIYTENNHRLWRDYHNGVITKEDLRARRFRQTFAEFGLGEELLPDSFEDDYVRICPTKTNLFPGTHEVLRYLSDKYHLHVITNGFKDSSDLKMNLTGLSPYFKNVFISEVIGIYKPDTALFRHAMQEAGSESHEVIMVGDSLEADIIGAKNSGIDQVFFNPNKHAHDVETTYEISDLNELFTIL